MYNCIISQWQNWNFQYFYLFRGNQKYQTKRFSRRLDNPALSTTEKDKGPPRLTIMEIKKVMKKQVLQVVFPGTIVLLVSKNNTSRIPEYTVPITTLSDLSVLWTASHPLLPTLQILMFYTNLQTLTNPILFPTITQELIIIQRVPNKGTVLKVIIVPGKFLNQQSSSLAKLNRKKSQISKKLIVVQNANPSVITNHISSEKDKRNTGPSLSTKSEFN